MQAFQFLFSTVIGALSVIFILRMWFQYCQVDFYNPISQSLAKFTNPVIKPLSKFIPTVKHVNLAALFVVFALGFIKVPLLSMSFMPSEILAYVLIGVLHILSVAGETLLYVLFFAAILSWFNRAPNPLQYILYQLTEPVLKPIRRILPNTGMIDFSPMVLAFILLFIDQLFNQYVPYWFLA
ncbi:hypothetical protein A6A19_04055 [Actinobacillus delphinicola]|uniref:YggT family protein n=1 Tax=Actinobacillus delphinicola TaxID=51161 RepID=UPI0024427FC1|nr:YggT family protein [Actinobacillus delphinicola]MDG6897186.1 hypothetical protein [Actinobacillus delphinicola]